MQSILSDFFVQIQHFFVVFVIIIKLCNKLKTVFFKDFGVMIAMRMGEFIGRYFHPVIVSFCSVRRIITNEKYVGDLRSGKYYSDNVISHKRKVNYGEKEQYFTSNHHEDIVSRELWNRCQKILEKRSKIVKPDGNRDKFSWYYYL